MTNRLFALKVGHREQWVSNLLAGRFSLKLDELDLVGGALGIPASELVRVSDAPWELSPTEARLVRACRMLPPAIRDQLVTLADYLIGVTPDEILHLGKYRSLAPENRRVIDQWLALKLVEQQSTAPPQEGSDRDAHAGADTPPGVRVVRTRPVRRRRGRS